MPTERKHVAVYLNEKEYKELEGKAKAEDRTVSNTAKRLIMNGLKDEDTVKT